MERLEASIGQLLLDLQNPRIVAAETQLQALSAIIELDPKHFKTMMESIRDHGLDPGDSFYVIESEHDPDDFIVVDGNRRLAALMVLREPNVLQGAGIANTVRTRLSKVAASFDKKSLSHVSVVRFDSRAHADEWILRRHGRGMQGEERIYWGTLEIQRFQRDRSILDVIDFIERNSTFTEERLAEIKSEIEGKASVLARFLEAKPIKELLGLSEDTVDDERIPSFSAPPKVAADVLSRIVGDIADGRATTRTYNTKTDFEAFVRGLPEELKDRASDGTKMRFRDAVIKGRGRKKRSTTAAATPPAKKTNVKQPRLYLAPRQHPFLQPPSEKAQRLLFEASRCSLRETPLSAAYIFRAFLENTIDGYIHTNGIPDFNKAKNQRHDLKGRAAIVLKHLVDNGRATKGNLRGVERTLTNPNDPASIQALNDYVHDKFHLPSGDTLREAWNSAEALFVGVYGPA